MSRAMTAGNHDHTGEEPRDLKRALLRGWARRCPACGTELHHHRADDGPAWATILITGHLMAPLMLMVFVALRPKGWQMAVGFSTVFVALSLYLLPRFKGLFVALQWAKRMHGFGGPEGIAHGA